mmetsp:Transcript_34990/g.108889  ORF Transcript_34990/g.108889 Transcript_34990/m.108889 type:complete len:373 (+) Transcript_34990:119-1237(+)
MPAEAITAKNVKFGRGPRPAAGAQVPRSCSSGLLESCPGECKRCPDVQVSSLGLYADAEARRLLRRALHDAWPAARQFDWQVGAVRELDPENRDVGYTSEDGTLFVKVRDPNRGSGSFYNYSFVLATLLHELTHLSVLGHGKAFYRQLVEAVARCGADPALRREVRNHVCAELLNAVCENDARRAKAVLAVLPEAVDCKLPGAVKQLPLEYAAHHGRVALTKLLLEAGAEVNATCCKGGVPPVMRAAARGNKRTAQVLLDAGATCSQAVDSVATAGGGLSCGGTPCCGSGRDESGASTSPREQPSAAKRIVSEGAPRRASSLPTLPTVLPVSSSRFQHILEARGGSGHVARVTGRAGASNARISMLSSSLAV